MRRQHEADPRYPGVCAAARSRAYTVVTVRTETALAAGSPSPLGRNRCLKRSTAIGTLVERHTRYLMLFLLPGGHTAEAVRVALATTI